MKDSLSTAKRMVREPTTLRMEPDMRVLTPGGTEKASEPFITETTPSHTRES